MTSRFWISIATTATPPPVAVSASPRRGGREGPDFGQFTRFNVSYVTGSHAFKTGVQHAGDQILDSFISGNRATRFGAPFRSR